MSEQKLIKSRILQRIDDEQNWTSVNPILSSAEIVFSRTQNGTFMKLGDGRHYLDTPFYQDIKIDENQISSLNFVHISKEDYELLVATSSVNESTIYFLSGDLDAYGRRIMNVKDATDISDAVNLGQMMAALDSVSSDISDYVPFSEDSAGTKTAVAIGKISSTPGTNSFAMGNNVAATGSNSFAFGNGVSATGTCSYAEGGDNLSGKSAESGEELLFAESRGYASHAEGAGLAIGRYSHAEGGGNSIIEGFMTRSTAEGGYSHAEGTHTWAKGANSHTEGSNTIVKSSTSHAEGKNNIVSNVSTDISIIQSISYVEKRGVNSHVEGQGNFIFGGNSHAEGKANSIYGHNSHVEGEFNIVSGRTSHAAGISADAYHDFTFVWNGISSQPFSSQTSGTFNVNPVGGASGVLVGQKSLAQLIEEGQTSSYSALTIGSRKSGSTIGSPSLAVGATTVASKASIAMGFQCEATANNSLANGQACKAGGAASHAEGYMSETKNQRSHADGYKAITDHDYAYAWNGIASVSAYHSNGVGTYSINPVGGTGGFYIGNHTLDQVINSRISSKADTSSLENYMKLSSDQIQGLSSIVEIRDGSSIDFESGSELNVDTGAQINMRSGASLNFLNSHSKAVVGDWSQISVRNSDRNLCIELGLKADLSAIHGDYITNGESTISANRAWSETRGYVWTVTISLGTYVLSCNEDGTSTWDQCELLEDGEGYEFWGRTIGCYEDDMLFFKLEYDIEGAVFHLTMKDKRDSQPADEYTLVLDAPLIQYLPHGPFGNWDAIVSYMPWTKTGILTTEDYVDEAISGKADLSAIPSNTSQLSNDSSFITSADISSKADISSVPKISVDGEIGDFGLMHVSRQDYEQILQDGPLSNVLYLVSSEYNNAYGMQIKNLSAGTDLSDAVNLYQLCSVTQDKADLSAIPTNISQLSNDSGFITAQQVPTPSYIQDENGNRIDADLTYSNPNWTGWRIEGSDELLKGTKDLANNSYMYPDPQEGDEYYQISFDSQTSAWSLYMFYWIDGSWGTEQSGMASGTIDDTTIEFTGWKTLVQETTNKTISTTDNIPTKVSQLQNDNNYVNGATLAQNYYNKTEIDGMIGDIDSVLDAINGEVI